MAEAASTIRPGRQLGVVVRDTTREKGYVFLRDAANNEYFAHKSAFSDVDWGAALVGSGFSFRSSTTSKGNRAFEIRTASPAEQIEIARMEEHRGNRT